MVVILFDSTLTICIYFDAHWHYWHFTQWPGPSASTPTAACWKTKQENEIVRHEMQWNIQRNKRMEKKIGDQRWFMPADYLNVYVRLSIGNVEMHKLYFRVHIRSVESSEINQSDEMIHLDKLKSPCNQTVKWTDRIDGKKSFKAPFRTVFNTKKKRTHNDDDDDFGDDAGSVFRSPIPDAFVAAALIFWIYWILVRENPMHSWLYLAAISRTHTHI